MKWITKKDIFGIGYLQLDASSIIEIKVYWINKLTKNDKSGYKFSICGHNSKIIFDTEEEACLTAEKILIKEINKFTKE